MKSLVIKNTHVQYESPITSGLKVMAKIKVYVQTTDTDSRAMALGPQTYLSRIAKKGFDLQSNLKNSNDKVSLELY